MTRSPAVRGRRALVFGALCAAAWLGPLAVLDLATPDDPASVADDARIALRGAVGDPAALVAGPLPPEGAGWEQVRSLALGPDAGAITLDWGVEQPVWGLLVQADAASELVVEASADLESWETVGRVPTVGGTGQRTRVQTLPRPLTTRALRLRATGAYAPFHPVTAFRVYPDEPDGWPRPVGTGVDAGGGYPWLDPDGVARAKLLLACLGAGLLALIWWRERRGQAAGALDRAFVATGLVAALGWWSLLQLSPAVFEQRLRNHWDVYHHYMGARYAAELGYTALYRCTLAVDLEDDLRGFHTRRHYTRDLVSNDFVPTRTLLADVPGCLDGFQPARADAFRRDVAWFRSRVGAPIWSRVFHDHGYNASPAWGIAATVAAHAVPLSDRGFDVLIGLDAVLVVAMGFMVWTTFGRRVAAMMFLFWGTNGLAGVFHTGGALLRYDWLAALVIGVCVLARGRNATGAGLLAYGTLSRVVPGFALLGLALREALDLLHRRTLRPSPPQRALLLAALATVVLVGAVSTLAAGRGDAWPAFVGNTLKHRATPQLQNVGRGALLAHVDRRDLHALDRVPLEDLEQSYASPGRRTLAAALGLLFLPLLARAVDRQERWVAAVLGLAALPFVTDVSNYYYVAVATFAALAVRKPVVAPGFAVLVVGGAALGATYDYEHLALFTWGSALVFGFSLWVAVLFALDRGAGPAGDGAGGTRPAEAGP